MKFLTILKYVILAMLAITGLRLVLFILASICKWIINKISERKQRKLYKEIYGDEEVSY